MRITLTDNDGLLLYQWKTNEYGDMMMPLPMSILLADIKSEIRRAIHRGEDNEYDKNE